jgi:hypothetical protein
MIRGYFSGPLNKNDDGSAGNEPSCLPGQDDV